MVTYEMTEPDGFPPPGLYHRIDDLTSDAAVERVALSHAGLSEWGDHSEEYRELFRPLARKMILALLNEETKP